MLREAKDAILLLRTAGYTINGIYAVTGHSITEICEVIYENSQAGVINDNVDNEL